MLLTKQFEPGPVIGRAQCPPPSAPSLPPHPHQPVGVSQRSRHLICSSDLTHFMGRFHPFNHLDYKMQGNRMSFVATGGLPLHVYVAWHAQSPTNGYLGGEKYQVTVTAAVALIYLQISFFTAQRKKFSCVKRFRSSFAQLTSSQSQSQSQSQCPLLKSTRHKLYLFGSHQAQIRLRLHNRLFDERGLCSLWASTNKQVDIKCSVHSLDSFFFFFNMLQCLFFPRAVFKHVVAS